MKPGILGAALAVGACFFTGSVIGHPFKYKRAYVTETVYVTQTIADATVYIDEDGKPYLTELPNLGTGAPTAVVDFTSTSEVAQPTTEVPLSSSSAPPVLPVSSELPPPAPESQVTSDSPWSDVSEAPYPTKQVTLTDNPPPATATPEPEPAPPAEAPQPISPPADPEATIPDTLPADKETVTGGQNGLGVTYDPFTGAGGETRCKTEDEISDEFEQMKAYKSVRIYGMGCDIIPLSIQNAIKNGQNIMAGVYLSNKGNGEDMSQVISTLKEAVDQHASGNWNIVQLFSVENERVNEKDMTASEVIDAIGSARDKLRSLGYNGPVGAVETVPAMIDNPAICEASDVVMVNCHAFFDHSTKAEDAGPFVKNEVERVKEKCNNKRVVVTESGWPHQGQPNGAAVPSVENQRIALESLHNNFDQDMFIHNAFDSPWKSDWAGSFGAERYWGVV